MTLMSKKILRNIFSNYPTYFWILIMDSKVGFKLQIEVKFWKDSFLNDLISTKKKVA